MAISKKATSSTHTAVAEPHGSLEEAVREEEKRPPVTQVVEVVEEVPQEEATQARPRDDQPLAETPATQEPESFSEPTQESPVTEEKRKEVVDEIFQKEKGESRVMPEISIHTKRRTSSIFLWALGTIVACLVVGAALLVMSGKTASLPSVVVVPTPTPTPTIQTTPTPATSELVRSAITIQVLNGGGKAGAATKMKEALEDKGYTVSDTGNADSYSYDKTVIQVKAGKSAYLPLLEKDLQDAYTLGTSSAKLDESVQFDARVIVGKE